MQKYTIRTLEGQTPEINGEPCLEEEYPDLQLFVGYFPCGDLGKNDCDCIQKHVGGCCKYRVCDVKSGAGMTLSLRNSKEDAIEATKRLIEKNGIENVKQKIQEMLITLERRHEP